MLSRHQQQFRANRHSNFCRSGRGRRASVGYVIDERCVSLMPHCRDQRDLAVEGGANDVFLIEWPEIFDRATAPSDDQHVRTVSAGHGIEAFDPRCDLSGSAVTLNQCWPDNDAHRKPVADAVQDIPDHGPGRAGDHANRAGQVGQFLLVLGGEQAFGGELLLPLLQQGHQCASACRAHGRGDHLVVGSALIDG